MHTRKAHWVEYDDDEDDTTCKKDFENTFLKISLNGCMDTETLKLVLVTIFFYRVVLYFFM